MKVSTNIKHFLFRGKKLVGMVLLFVILSSVVAKAVHADYVPPPGSSTPAAAKSETKETGKKAEEDSGGFFGWMGSGLLKIVVFLIWVMFVAVAKFYLLAMWLLDVLMNPGIYTSLLTGTAVQQGWETVRDFVNLFFVIILLFIAICTILRVESYSAKSMLAGVLAAALLINFSKPITIVIIDVSQLAMTFFMDNIKAGGSYSSQMSQALGMGSVMDVIEKTPDTSGSMQTIAILIISLIFGIVFMLILAMMLLVVALGLVLRIVAFMVLIILSPAAFAGMPLKGTPLRAMYDRWIDKMTNWAFFGPSMLFFAWLALIVAKQVSTSTLATQISTPSAGANLSDLNANTIFQGVLKNTIPYIVAIYFLYYGYDLSKAMANKAGKSVGGLFNKGEGYINRWAKRGGFVAAGIGTAGMAPLAYRTATRSAENWKTRAEGAKDRARKYIPFGPKSKEERERELAEKRAAWAGGEKQNSYFRGEASKLRKKWKDEGDKPDDNKLYAMLKDKDATKARAAAMELAESGKLKVDWNDPSKNYYTQALAAAGKDAKLRTDLKNMAKEKNIASVVEHDINEEKKFGGDRQEAYEHYLKGKSYKQLTQQSNNVSDDKNTEFHSYLVRRATSGGSRGIEKDRLQKIVDDSKMDGDGMANWNANIIDKLPEPVKKPKADTATA